MQAHCLTRGGFVTVLNCDQNGLMLGNQPRGIVIRQLWIAIIADRPAWDQCLADQPQKFAKTWVVRCLRDGGVKGEIGVRGRFSGKGEASKILKFFNNCLFLRGRMPQSCISRGIAFDCGAQFQHFDQRRDPRQIDIAKAHAVNGLCFQHENAGALAGLHKPIGSKGCNRFTDDGPADTEL